MVLFLAAITLFLFSRVLGADDAPFGPVMGKRGESGATTGAGSSSREPTTEAASASETPRRSARVRLVKSRNSVGRDRISANRTSAIRAASFHGRHSIS